MSVERGTSAIAASQLIHKLMKPEQTKK